MAMIQEAINKMHADGFVVGGDGNPKSFTELEHAIKAITCP
jgi:hypothetical protein